MFKSERLSCCILSSSDSPTNGHTSGLTLAWIQSRFFLNFDLETKAYEVFFFSHEEKIVCVGKLW